MTSSKRLMKGTTVLNRLKSAAVVTVGVPAKFNLLSTNGGTPYMREDGTLVRIVNVCAFATDADAGMAKAYWTAGYKLELTGDEEGAHEEYIKASNLMMSFSSLETYADGFNGCYEVSAMPAKVTNQKGEEVIVLNNVRPVAVAAAAKTALFNDLDPAAIAAQIAAETAAPKTTKPVKPSTKAQNKVHTY